MKFLNSQQLAFILDIKKEDARAKMVCAWEKSKGIERNKFTCEVKGAIRTEKNKVQDDYPVAMPVDILSEHLIIPNLQSMVDDIIKNYLVRPASKKYILCDLPEKLVLKAKEAGTKPKTAIPPALKSMLPTATQRIIMEEWVKRFKEFRPDYQPNPA